MNSPDDPVARPARTFSRRTVVSGGLALGGTALGVALTRTSIFGTPTEPETTLPVAPASERAPETFPEDRRVRVQHLLRRAGFSPTHDEVQRALQLGDDELIDAIVHPERIDDGLPPDLAAPPAEAKPADLASWWIARMAATAQPTLEKTTFFWHGLHTSGFDKLGNRGVPAMAAQYAFQRDSAYARFTDILKGISKQPAMLTYLDGVDSTRAHPNENFARELMELFSMGEGHYSEQDVREAARAFTGYSFDRATLEFRRRPAQSDNGIKTVLGMTGPLDGDAVIEAIGRHEATPRYVATRVWSAFAYPDPEPSVIDEIARTFRDTGGDIREVLRAVFSHPAFFGPRAYRALVKGPVEYAVGALRQLGVQPRERNALLGPLRTMGQVPFNPPNVAGWRGGATWVGSGALLAGLNAVDSLVFAARGGFDAARYLEQRRIATADDLVTDLTMLLVDGRVPTESRSTLIDYASNSRGADARLDALPEAQRTARVRGTIYLVAAGPEYHLA